MNRFNIFRFSLVSVLLGVIIAHLYAESFLMFLFVTGFILGAIFLKKFRLLFFCLILSILLGYFRVLVAEDFLDQNDLLTLSKTEQEIELKGIISSKPEMKDNRVRYTISEIEIFNEKYTGDIQFYFYPYPRYFMGQEIMISGTLYFPEKLDGFDYPAYLKMKGIYGLIKNPYISDVSAVKETFFTKLFELKDLLEKRTTQIFSSPQDRFLNGLLYGSRDGLPENVQNHFQITGLTHIIAISGYNITLIISICLALLCFLPRKIRLICAGFFVVIFTIFVGADASVVRACIMGLISLIALYTGRTTEIITTLLFVAVSMVLANWRVLFYDVGFQLSFAATSGLVFFSPILLKFTAKIPEFLSMKEALLLTISAQITTIPVILYHFGKLSLVSPLANILVAPFIPLAMFFGFFAVLASFISYTLGVFISAAAYFSLQAILKIAEFMSTVPLASLDIRASLIWISFYYVFIAFIYFDAKRSFNLI